MCSRVSDRFDRLFDNRSITDDEGFDDNDND